MSRLRHVTFGDMELRAIRPSTVQAWVRARQTQSAAASEPFIDILRLRAGVDAQQLASQVAAVTSRPEAEIARVLRAADRRVDGNPDPTDPTPC